MAQTKKQKALSVDTQKLHGVDEAIALARTNATAKFDETIEVAMRLGVDTRKADQMVRGTVNLPNGTGKTARVLVFATGERAAAATEAGADEVGADEHGQVGPVVDDERDAEPPRDLPRLLQHAEELPVGQRLLPELDEVDPAAHGRLEEREVEFRHVRIGRSGIVEEGCGADGIGLPRAASRQQVGPAAF